MNSVTAPTYVHGYSAHEAQRLTDQADTLAGLLHADTVFAPGSRVLELGCGTGAQTVHVLSGNPGIALTAVDISEQSLTQAQDKIGAHIPDADVAWMQADLFDLTFADRSFDHLLLCFVLEHLREPERALSELRRLLVPGGSIAVIEGDHGTAVFHPDSVDAHAVIGCQVRLQARAGGNAFIGRTLQPLLAAAGYVDVTVCPRTVYADQTRPALVSGFTRNTFTAMIESVREPALTAQMISPGRWQRGIADLHRTAAHGGTFHYTFFKAHAIAPHSNTAGRSCG